MVIAAGRGLDSGVLAEQWAGQCRLLGWGERTAASARSQPLIAHPGGGRPISGTALRWLGPGQDRTWELLAPAIARCVAGGDRAWATLDGAPIIAPRRVGGRRGFVCGIDPADAGSAPELGAILRRALLAALPAAAWLDLRNTVVLRMDDPGASASVQLDPWSYERLGETAWREIGDVLDRHGARITVAYTPGWADDGDPGRGELRVGGRAVKRIPGSVHPSPLVRYRGRDAPSADCAAEFRGVLGLRERGLCTVELHGCAHVHPDRERWARSPTAHTKLGWYRELGPEVAAILADLPQDEHPIGRGRELFERHFGERPVALVPPANAWSAETLTRAHRLGLDAVCARGLAVRSGDGFRWLAGVPAVPLDAPGSRALAAEGPVMAWFHDRDLSLRGVPWLRDQLDRWRGAGAQRFIDVRELVAALGLRLALEPGPDGGTVTIVRERGPALARDFPALVRTSDPPRGELTALTHEGRLRLDATPSEDGARRVMIPAGT